MIGQELNNRYKITAHLGEGGMGEVYRATDEQTKQQVAVKVLARQLTTHSESLERFRREAETLRQLDHPNIVKFVDAFEHDRQYVIVMEFVSGGSLFDLLQQGLLPIDRARRIALELCDALIRSHHLNIIHRDIKPENVLLTEDGRPKLADFGVARLSEGSRMTRTGTQVGTPYYMAPEAWEGKALDAQADIWSLGVLLFEMLTGKLPFSGDTGAAVMNKVLTTKPPDLRKMRSDVPHGLVNIVSHMLTRDQKVRYQTTRQLAADLESGEFMKPTRPVQGTRIVTPDLNARTGIYKFLLIFGILIFGVLGVGGVIAVGWKLSATPPALTKTPLPSPVVDRISALDSTAAPIVSGGEWIAFNSRLAGNSDIYLVDLQGKNLTQLTTSPAHDLYPSWSPDAKHIVYQTTEGGDQELVIINISNKKSMNLTDNNCNDWAPVWSPADDWIVYYSDCGGDRNIYKIRTDGSERTQLTSTSGSYSWFPAWSADGRKITFSSNRSGKYRIYVMDANGGAIQDLAAGCVSYFSPDGKQILYGVYCDDTDDLFLMNADGTNQRQITDNDECKNATWSSDGKSIIFQLSRTTKDGPFALYIMSLDNPQKSNWTLLTDYDVNGGSPVWQP